MSRDLYASWSGASAAWRQLERVAQNVANAGTPGFREATTTFRLPPEPGSPLESASVAPDGVGYRRTDGTLETDGVDTHLALRGDGFFALADGTFTRDGGFRLDAERQLVTAEGTPVLTDAGPIQLEEGERFVVDADGLVTGTVQGEIGRLRIVRLPDGAPLGGNRWGGTPQAADGVAVVQGAREGSNVDPMRAMVELMEASRFFEAQQKAMQTSDEMRSRLNRMQG